MLPAAHHFPPLQSRLGWELLTFRVKEWDDAQLTLSHIECVLQVVPGIGVFQLIKVNQVRPEEEARLSEGGGGHGIPTNRAALVGCKGLGQMQGGDPKTLGRWREVDGQEK